MTGKHHSPKVECVGVEIDGRPAELPDMHRLSANPRQISTKMSIKGCFMIHGVQAEVGVTVATSERDLHYVVRLTASAAGDSR